MHEKWRISNQRIFPSKDEENDSRKTDGRDARDREETNEEDQSNLITIFEISNKYSAL